MNVNNNPYQTPPRPFRPFHPINQNTPEHHQQNLNTAVNAIYAAINDQNAIHAYNAPNPQLPEENQPLPVFVLPENFIYITPPASPNPDNQ